MARKKRDDEKLEAEVQKMIEDEERWFLTWQRLMVRVFRYRQSVVEWSRLSYAEHQFEEEFIKNHPDIQHAEFGDLYPKQGLFADDNRLAGALEEILQHEDCYDAACHAGYQFDCGPTIFRIARDALKEAQHGA